MGSSQQLSALVEKHVSTLKSEGAEISKALRGDPVDIVAGREAAHKIKGSSGSIGFSDLSAAAALLEAQLKAKIRGSEEVDAETFEMLAKVEAILAELEPSQSSLFSSK